MLVFYPRFEISKSRSSNFSEGNRGENLDFLVENLILLDCSNSMKMNGNFSRSQEIVKTILMQLHPSSYFNIVSFGAGKSDSLFEFQ